MRKVKIALLSMIAFFVAGANLGCEEGVASAVKSSSVSFVTSVVGVGLNASLGG